MTKHDDRWARFWFVSLCLLALGVILVAAVLFYWPGVP